MEGTPPTQQAALGIKAMTNSVMDSIQKRVIGMSPMRLNELQKAVQKGIEDYVELVNKPLAQWKQPEQPANPATATAAK
jgi:hypothetical protein